MSTRAVTFDAFGTLLHMLDPAPRLRASLAARYGLDVPLERCRAGMQAEVRAYHALPAAGTPAELADVRARYARVLADALAVGLGHGELAVPLLDAVRFVPATGAHAALRELRAEGLRVAIVSNWDISLRDHLGALGLAGLVDDVVLSGEHRVAKPAPGLYRIAAARLRVGARDVLHVGDHPRNDVDAARAAGLRALLLDPRPLPPRAPSVRDLPGAARLALAR